MDQDQNMTPKDDAFPAAISTEKSNLSMLVGVGAFLIILASLGWYVLQGGMGSGETVVQAPPSVNTVTSQTTTSSTTTDAAAAALSTQGSSDEAADINADLKATDLNSLNDINKI